MVVKNKIGCRGGKIIFNGFLLIFFIGVVSAFPFQLLPNGTLVDINSSNFTNGTPVDIVMVNGSIYLIPAENQTINY